MNLKFQTFITICFALSRSHSRTRYPSLSLSVCVSWSAVKFLKLESQVIYERAVTED